MLATHRIQKLLIHTKNTNKNELKKKLQQTRVPVKVEGSRSVKGSPLLVGFDVDV